MKKILLTFLILFTSFLLVSCTNKKYEVVFHNINDHQIKQNDIEPDYLENIYVTINGEKINAGISVDSKNVDTSKVGTYEITYLFSYLFENQKIMRNKKANVIVFENNNSNNNAIIKTYYLNDLHGALLENEKSYHMGLPKIGNLILDEMKNNPNNTLFIAGGDMLQGQLISNHFTGESTIHMLNEMKLDAFVIGNHEFDWGLDNVLKYFNGKNHLQASYPLLGANVYKKGTKILPEGIKPYTIVNKDDIRIGIIGLIGELESSISYEFIKDYEFDDPYKVAKSYIEYLKNNNLVDSIYVAIHHENNSFNDNIAKLDVDMIFNAHTHRSYTRKSNNVNIIQSGSSGTNLGEIVATYDVNKKAIDVSAKNLDSFDDTRLNSENTELKELLNLYYEEVEPLITTPILISGDSYTKDELTTFIARTMREKLDGDIAFHNTGGTRESLSYQENITSDKIMRILPFDNLVITMDLSGREIKNFARSFRASKYSINPIIGTSIDDFDDTTYYRLVVHSYMYGNGSSFVNAKNYTETPYFIRDTLEEYIVSLRDNGHSTFYTYLEYSFNENNSKKELTIDIS